MDPRTLAAGPELDALTALVRSFTAGIASRSGTWLGSGVVWHPDGLVVTNAHVVRDARPLVTVAGAGTLEGRVVAADRKRDLALVRVDATGLAAAQPGDAGSLAAGSLVLALGHPLGVAHALSLGVVHGVTTRHGTPRFISADIRLAPGNSGGPLVDTRARVVGVNAMIVGGLGVAIATSVVRAFLRDASLVGAVPFTHPQAA